jgi:type I restriction enzyme, S subunit
MRDQIEMPLRSTSGVNNLNTEEVRGLIVPLPPIDEQREIVARAGALMQLADELAERIARASKAVERSAQAVLAKAFRGELNPADAPA